MTRVIENIKTGISAINSLSTHKPFLFSLKDLDPYKNEDGKSAPKQPKEIKYLTLEDEILIIAVALTFGLPWLARDPAKIGPLVRQWGGIDGEKAYLECLQKKSAHT